MKKILSLILALLMIVSCASFIFADENDAAEVKESDSKYYDAVQFLVNYDIMHGKGDKLGVYDNIKRYEMALFIGRICTGWVADDQWEDGTEDKSGFVDLAGTAAESFYGAISYVAQKGIIVGVGGNKFAPEAGIKYEDALTMAVRALGYNDLAYPWGYIDKAVNLGLTAGIEGIAYSETLKREVVAQIVYNALFAATAEGDTLAKRNFNLDLNYETIMITATDGGYYAPNGKTAPAGYVAYQVVEADGTLNSQVYYDTAESFGFADAHDDERALGTLYKAVFNKNANNGLGTIVSAESLELDTVWNLGLDSMEAGAYPVAKYLANKTLVSYYATKTAFNAGVNQFILVRDDGVSAMIITDLVAVDWYTGNILVKDNKGVYQVAWYYNQLLDVYFRYQVAVKDNGDVTLVGVEYMTVEDAAKIYGNVGINKIVIDVNCYGAVTDAEAVKKLGKTAYASLRIFEGENYGIYDEYRFGYLTKTAPILDTSKLDKNSVADKWSQVLGYRENVAAWQNLSDEEWAIKGPMFPAALETYVNEGFDVYDYSNVLNGLAPTKTLPFASTETLDVEGAKTGWATFQNGGTGKDVAFGLRVDDVWFTDGVEPEEGWVIYGANPSTNEVTIVKTIDEYTEGAESYVATGVLRSYNMAKKTLTIGDQTFSTEYDALIGTAFNTNNYVDGYWWAGSQYVAALFNQFVTYVVVDGKVVYIEACGNEELRFLVVDSYAGIARDGNIVINAWDTADGKNKQIRIANCDGWKFGDFFYYDANYTTEAAKLFTRGTVLQILSYNPTTDAYGVTAIDGLRSDVDGRSAQKYSIKNAYGTDSYDFTWFEFNFKFAQVGIRVNYYLGGERLDPKSWETVNNGGHNDKAGSGSTNGLKRNMTKDDKYVFIFADGEIAGSPVRIFTGDAINPAWSVKGWRLVGTDGKTHIFMGLKAANVSGFNIDQSASNHTAVIMIDYNGIDSDGKAYTWRLPELGMNMPEYQVAMGSDSRYEPSKGGNPSPWGYVIDAAYDQGNLIGATEYSVTVLDLRTLQTITVKTTEKALKWNYIYEVQDGKVVGTARDANDLYTMLNAMFVHDGIDLLADTTIGKVTDVTLAQAAAGGAPLRSADLNCWMTEQYLHVAGGYADFGGYTIPRKAKFASLVTVYEAADGHAEIGIIGTEDADGLYSKSGNKNLENAKYSAEDIAKLTGGATALKAVSLINMDRVKMAGNCNPYDGQMAVTYLFNADLVD